MENLRVLRIEKGFTQKELADIVGCGQSAIGKYERGELEPNLSTLKQFSEIFDVSIDYLVGRTDDFGNVCVPGQTSDLTADDALMKDFNKLDVYEQEYIRGQIKALVAKKDLEKEKV